MGLQAFQQSQSVGMQCAGFQHKHRNVELQTVQNMGDDHVFSAQAGGLLQRLQFSRCALELRLCGGQLLSELGAGFGVQLRGGYVGFHRANKGWGWATSPW